MKPGQTLTSMETPPQMDTEEMLTSYLDIDIAITVGEVLNSHCLPSFSQGWRLFSVSSTEPGALHALVERATMKPYLLL